MNNRLQLSGKQLSSRRALSLLEVVASTLIMGVVVVGALNTLGSVYKTRALNASRLMAPGLAHELMNEVLSMAYTEPNESATTIGIDEGEAQTTRTTFDDIDDYHNWDKLGAETKDGTVLDGYEDYRRQVTVSWMNINTMSAVNAESGLKLITVTVTDPDGMETQLMALRHQRGALEQSVAMDMTAVTWMGGELQLNSKSPVARHGTMLTNFATDTIAP